MQAQSSLPVFAEGLSSPTSTVPSAQLNWADAERILVDVLGQAPTKVGDKASNIFDKIATGIERDLAKNGKSVSTVLAVQSCPINNIPLEAYRSFPKTSKGKGKGKATGKDKDKDKDNGKGDNKSKKRKSHSNEPISMSLDALSTAQFKRAEAGSSFTVAPLIREVFASPLQLSAWDLSAASSSLPSSSKTLGKKIREARKALEKVSPAEQVCFEAADLMTQVTTRRPAVELLDIVVGTSSVVFPGRNVEIPGVLYSEQVLENGKKKKDKENSGSSFADKYAPGGGVETEDEEEEEEEEPRQKGKEKDKKSKKNEAGRKNKSTLDKADSSPSASASASPSASSSPMSKYGGAYAAPYSSFTSGSGTSGAFDYSKFIGGGAKGTSTSTTSSPTPGFSPSMFSQYTAGVPGMSGMGSSSLSALSPSQRGELAEKEAVTVEHCPQLPVLGVFAPSSDTVQLPPALFAAFVSALRKAVGESFASEKTPPGFWQGTECVSETRLWSAPQSGEPPSLAFPPVTLVLRGTPSPSLASKIAGKAKRLAQIDALPRRGPEEIREATKIRSSLKRLESRLQKLSESKNWSKHDTKHEEGEKEALGMHQDHSEPAVFVTLRPETYLGYTEGCSHGGMGAGLRFRFRQAPPAFVSSGGVEVEEGLPVANPDKSSEYLEKYAKKYMGGGKGSGAGAGAGAGPGEGMGMVDWTTFIGGGAGSKTPSNTIRKELLATPTPTLVSRRAEDIAEARTVVLGQPVLEGFYSLFKLFDEEELALEQNRGARGVFALAPIDGCELSQEDMGVATPPAPKAYSQGGDLRAKYSTVGAKYTPGDGDWTRFMAGGGSGVGTSPQSSSTPLLKEGTVTIADTSPATPRASGGRLRELADELYLTSQTHLEKSALSEEYSRAAKEKIKEGGETAKVKVNESLEALRTAVLGAFGKTEEKQAEILSRIARDLDTSFTKEAQKDAQKVAKGEMAKKEADQKEVARETVHGILLSALSGISSGFSSVYDGLVAVTTGTLGEGDSTAKRVSKRNKSVAGLHKNIRAEDDKEEEENDDDADADDADDEYDSEYDSEYDADDENDEGDSDVEVKSVRNTYPTEDSISLLYAEKKKEGGKNKGDTKKGSKKGSKKNPKKDSNKPRGVSGKKLALDKTKVDEVVVDAALANTGAAYAANFAGMYGSLYGPGAGSGVGAIATSSGAAAASVSGYPGMGSYPGMESSPTSSDPSITAIRQFAAPFAASIAVAAAQKEQEMAQKKTTPKDQLYEFKQKHAQGKGKGKGKAKDKAKGKEEEMQQPTLEPTSAAFGYASPAMYGFAPTSPYANMYTGAGVGVGTSSGAPFSMSSFSPVPVFSENHA